MNIREETLKIARNLIKKDPSLTDWVISKFPELKESEDEKIRNFLIDFIKVCSWTEKKDQGWPLREECIAWLEKQGEHANFRNNIQIGDKVTRNKDGVLVNLSQLKRVAKKDEKQGEKKSVDNDAEPKFHEGDWLQYRNAKPFFVEEITKQGYISDDSCLPFEWENEIHPWAIQDAKDGDVLEFGDHGRLVVGIVSYVNKTTGRVDVNCLLENNNFKVGNYYNLDTIKPHPAAKEQRDTLMKAMADAGYEWDAEKKELRKIEKKPTWSEEDERMYRGLHNLIYSTPYCDSRKELSDWLKSLKYRYTWKPSDEQMEALDRAQAELCNTEYNKPMCDLIDSLNKLMKE